MPTTKPILQQPGPALRPMPTSCAVCAAMRKLLLASGLLLLLIGLLYAYLRAVIGALD